MNVEERRTHAHICVWRDRILERKGNAISSAYKLGARIVAIEVQLEQEQEDNRTMRIALWKAGLMDLPDTAQEEKTDGPETPS